MDAVGGRSKRAVEFCAAILWQGDAADDAVAARADYLVAFALWENAKDAAEAARVAARAALDRAEAARNAARTARQSVRDLHSEAILRGDAE